MEGEHSQWLWWAIDLKEPSKHSQVSAATYPAARAIAPAGYWVEVVRDGESLRDVVTRARALVTRRQEERGKKRGKAA